MADSTIPVLDVRSMSADPDDLKRLAQEVHHAFTTIGFLAVVNHGIHQDQVVGAWKQVSRFFELSPEQKSKYGRNDAKGVKSGWSPLASELLFNREDERQSKGDYKETYDVIPHKQKFPDEVPEMKKNVLTLYESLKQLASYIYRLMAIALELEDKEFFNKCHNLGQEGNTSDIRFLWYPPVPQGGLVEGQMRCGEHTDFCSMTLLIQDDNGGLEVKRNDGVWLESHPEPGTIMVNIGDLMQRWTSDVFKSTKHRVRVTEDEAQRNRLRRSIAFFTHPDLNTIVECLHNTNKYPPVDGNEYIHSRTDEVYG